MFKYKNFIGSISYSREDGCYHGHILEIADTVTYESQTIPGLKKSFEDSVNDYLKTCEELNRSPRFKHLG
jgi:predicted HicB family RNase H-like nuclease